MEQINDHQTPPTTNQIPSHQLTIPALDKDNMTPWILAIRREQERRRGANHIENNNYTFDPYHHRSVTDQTHVILE